MGTKKNSLSTSLFIDNVPYIAAGKRVHPTSWFVQYNHHWVPYKGDAHR